MKYIVAIVTVFLALVSGNLALAQSTGDLGTMLGDVLGGLLSVRQGHESSNGRRDGSPMPMLRFGTR